MIQVVIADDEMRICQLIEALVDWKSLGMSVAGTAANGLEALDIVTKQMVDILITDIRMPGCDGLDLIARVRQASPRTHMIIISGFAHFDYARTALKYGVEEYLLKPVNRQELQNALEKLRGEIEEERNVSELENGSWKEEDFRRFRTLLVTDLTDHRMSVRTWAAFRERYHFETGENAVCIAFCLRMDAKTGEASEDVLLEKAGELLEMELRPVAGDLVWAGRGGTVRGVVSCGKGEREALRDAMKGGLSRIVARRSIFGEADFSIGLGTEADSPDTLEASMRTAEKAVCERIIRGTGRVLELSKTQSVMTGAQRILDTFIRDASAAIQAMSTEKLRIAADRFLDSVMTARPSSGWEIRELTERAGSACMIYAAGGEGEKEADAFLEKCRNARSVKELVDALCDFLEGQIRRMLASREEDTARPIRLARQYIDDHYSEPISLDDVSAAAGLTPSYFSVLFKKENGEGFARCLLNVRMQAAKEMLRESGMTVAEICRQVGYTDVKYFTRVFEKENGVKPSVYRKLYG